MNETPFIDSIPGDALIFLCLIASSLARLTRNESISAMAALKEFYWSLIVGAAITGCVIYQAEWHMKTAWWVALAAPLASSFIVEILIAKGDEIKKMPIKELLPFILDEIQKRFTKTTVKP
ncbi:hypothetical protein [Spirosoma endbachense]|uniref:Uncharacterized protein n=1 Tax=Spirosoma endbachense TaxID=2666025 RepID=A0A6P1W5M9_9BACT|nr:hypothetical protein [Spirosoma endbachense]QHV99240.1 hypothetical protein GJR95_31375 [Spirosoma endbachense]